MSGYTPGPWSVDFVAKYPDKPKVVYGIQSADGTVIVETDAGFYPPREADARLIAAAPEMLAELQNIITANIHQEDRRRIEEVIAKATQP
jgi:hypothetical protein